MARDLLLDVSPRELIRSEQGWRLEVERLICMAGNLYRPSRKCVEGEEAILAHLEHNPRGRPLLEGAIAILGAPEPAAGSLQFQAIGGDWVPAAAIRARELADASRPMRWEGPEVTQVLGLELGQRDAMERIQQLERRIEELTALASRAAKQVGGPAPDAPSGYRDDAEFAADLGFDAPEQGELDASALEDPALDDEDDFLEQSEPLPAEASAALPVRAPVTVPAIKALRENLHMLIDPGLRIKEQRGERRVRYDVEDLCEHYVCALLEDGDEVVGAMIADLPATVGLGCELLGIPAAERQRQLDSGLPSDDVIESVSEIFNTLSGPYNLIDTNPHVRIRALAPLDPDSFPWLAEARERVSLEVAGYGMLLLLSV